MCSAHKSTQNSDSFYKKGNLNAIFISIFDTKRIALIQLIRRKHSILEKDAWEKSNFEFDFFLFT